MSQIVRGINSYTASVGDVLRKNVTYFVPEYQRDYSWTLDEVEMLWSDIIGAITRPNDDYFMGAIVMSPSQKKDSWDIVDGQQRLATLSMVLSIIQRQWKIAGNDRHYDIRRDYLVDRNIETNEYIPKISLNANNNSTYNSVVIEHTIIAGAAYKTLNKSNRLIIEAFNKIDDLLNEWLSEKPSREKGLAELEKYISNRLKLIIIEAVSDYDAYLIFETLNDRGLDLAVSDLVKNHLLRHGGSRIDDFKNKWAEINQLVGEDLKIFFRHFWISENKLIVERDLYKAIREKITSQSAARPFLDRMHKAAKYYAALSTPESDFWNDYPDSMRDDLSAMNVFKLIQYKPIILALIERFSPKQVAEAMSIIVTISVRYSIISAMSTGTLEKTYGRAIIAINNSNIKTPKDLFNELKSVYIDDIRFKDNIISKEFDKPSIVRYILSKIENYVSGDSEKEAIHAGKVTLEHVLPQSQMQYWGLDELDAELLVSKLGNLTLLEKRKNQKISNKSFTEKVSVFKESSLSINHMIAEQAEWNKSKIDDRTESLASAAVKIWRLSY